MLLYIVGWKNMTYKRFSLVIVVNTALIMLTLLALTYFVNAPGYHAVTLLILILLISLCLLTYRFIVKTNTELTRFFDAVRHADFSQRFEFKQFGAGFEELGQTFTDILKQFQLQRAQQAEELIHLKSIIEHAPVPLISIYSQGEVTLWNNSARRLFGSTPVNFLKDLVQFGEHFSQQINTIEAGERRLVNFTVVDMEQQFTISATKITIAGRQTKLISMHNIQNELDTTQLQAWQDLVSVLTHEIMNSITPVISLAKTSVLLLDDVNKDISHINELKKGQLTKLKEELTDVSSAVRTVARRSDALMEFVGRYRRLTDLPTLNKQSIHLEELFERVISIASVHWLEQDIQFELHITPPTLTAVIDINMVEQILINLLKNAEQAVENINNALISMTVSLNKLGHVVIDIADNGCGVDEDIEKQIFVPFFTTKVEGSGVGLALTRQVMIAHGGMVKLEKSPLGDTLFRLIF